MAGIGFELKKIYRKQSIFRVFLGAFYSTTVVLGPSLIIILLLLAMYLGVGFFSIDYVDRELLSSAILYVFIFSVIITSAFNAVFSRYIADKIYNNEYEDIMPSYYACLGFCCVVASLFGIPFSLRVLFVGGVEFGFVLLFYISFMAMVTILISMIYLHATKEYRIITLFFAIGALVGIALALILFYIFRVSVTYSLLCSIASALVVIAALEFSYIRKFFNLKSMRYKDCIKYLIKFKTLFFCNLFYSLGLYVHNFVFWTKPGNIIVAESFVSHPTYDMATFLAVFSNISMMVLFTVMVETKFHEHYQSFNEAVYGSTLSEISVLKSTMFRALEQQQVHLMGMQAIITIILYVLAMVFLPLVGISSNILTIYALLCVAYYVMLIMYTNFIVLFYFNDTIGSLISAAVFFVCTFVGTLVSSDLSMELFGAGAFFGSLVGWTVSSFRIRYLRKTLDVHIFCNMKTMDTKKERKPSDIVYVREQTFDKLKDEPTS